MSFEHLYLDFVLAAGLVVLLLIFVSTYVCMEETRT